MSERSGADPIEHEPPPTDEAEVVHIDGGDLGCARLFILLRNRIRTIADGTVLHVTTLDPVAPIDLPVWCRITGHTYLGRVADRGGPTYAVRVTGEPVPTMPDRPWHTAG
ncbi:MAG TPA: sulfurtransferase TusA family protein [Actinotalea sp.]|nr:sulfurtransferase TusA family protein [Actinotalea sp.]